MLKRAGEARLIVLARDFDAAEGAQVVGDELSVEQLVVAGDEALEQVGHHSVRVPVMDEARFAEVCELRLLLEGRAAAHAADHATAADVRRLEALHEDMAAQREAGDAAAELLAAERFHMEVYALARMPVLQRMVEGLWLQCGPLMRALQTHALAQPRKDFSGKQFSGVAAYYSKGYRGPTARGERYDPAKFTAAHRSLPFGTRLRVTDKRTGRSVEVIVNDRGPFTKGRVLDLSYAAAQALRMQGRGLIQVIASVE